MPIASVPVASRIVAFIDDSLSALTPRPLPLPHVIVWRLPPLFGRLARLAPAGVRQFSPGRPLPRRERNQAEEPPPVDRQWGAIPVPQLLEPAHEQRMIPARVARFQAAHQVRERIGQ